MSSFTELVNKCKQDSDKNLNLMIMKFDEVVSKCEKLEKDHSELKVNFEKLEKDHAELKTNYDNVIARIGGLEKPN